MYVNLSQSAVLVSIEELESTKENRNHETTSEVFSGVIEMKTMNVIQGICGMTGRGSTNVAVVRVSKTGRLGMYLHDAIHQA